MFFASFFDVSLEGQALDQPTSACSLTSFGLYDDEKHDFQGLKRVLDDFKQERIP